MLILKCKYFCKVDYKKIKPFIYLLILIRFFNCHINHNLYMISYSWQIHNILKGVVMLQLHKHLLHRRRIQVRTNRHGWSEILTCFNKASCANISAYQFQNSPDSHGQKGTSQNGLKRPSAVFQGRHAWIN